MFMDLEPQDWQAINGCLLRLYRELDKEKHARLMLQIIHELVPGDTVALTIFTPPDKVTHISLPAVSLTTAESQAMLKFSDQTPFPAYYMATRDSSWRMTTDFMPLEDFHSTDLYRQVYEHLGMDQEMCGLLAVVETAGYGLSISRPKHTHFTERDREILNTLHPHLVTSYLNAIRHSQAGESVSEIKAMLEAAPGAYGYFCSDGRLMWLQQRAASWLHEFFSDEVKTPEGVPQRIIHLLKESISGSLAAKSLEKIGGDEILTVCLGGSPMGGRILRLERKPKTPLPRFRPLPQFSERKNDVLKWMVEGKRNAEIAKILHISPRTVERHVTEILAGLSVENRATAIVRAMEFCAAANLTMQVTM